MTSYCGSFGRTHRSIICLTAKIKRSGVCFVPLELPLMRGNQNDEKHFIFEKGQHAAPLRSFLLSFCIVSLHFKLSYSLLSTTAESFIQEELQGPPANAHNRRLGVEGIVRRLSNFVSKIKFSKENQDSLSDRLIFGNEMLPLFLFPHESNTKSAFILKQILVGYSDSNFVSLSRKNKFLLCVSHFVRNIRCICCPHQVGNEDQNFCRLCQRLRKLLCVQLPFPNGKHGEKKNRCFIPTACNFNLGISAVLRFKENFKLYEKYCTVFSVNLDMHETNYVNQNACK